MSDAPSTLNAPCASEVQLLLLVECLVVGSREGVFAETPLLPFELMAFLQDAIDLPKSHNFCSRMELVHSISSYFHCEASQDCHDFMNEYLSCTALEDLDALDSFFDRLPTLFHEDPAMQVNAVCGPTRLCRDSFLGLFVRSMCARWESLPFDSMCSIFDAVQRFHRAPFQSQRGSSSSSSSSSGSTPSKGSRATLSHAAASATATASAFDRGSQDGATRALLYDLGTADAVVDAYPASNIPGIAANTRPTDLNPSFYLLNAQKASIAGDVLVAEESLHRYFDNSNAQLRNVMAPGSSVMGDEACLHALQSLEGTALGPQYLRTRQQTAMLALAVIWERGGYTQLALRGTEEAMKTAHQRGDHAAVTHALLLLYKIVHADSENSHSTGSSGSSSGSNAMSESSSEETLQRCLARCASLDLRSLSTQAALLLVRHRAKGLLSAGNGEVLNNHVSAVSGGPDSDSTAASVPGLWTLLATAAYGDATATARAGGALASLLPSNANSQQQAVNAESPASVVEAAMYITQAAETAMELWSRLGCPFMAELAARRALRQLGVHATSTDLVGLITRMSCARAAITADAANECSSSSSSSSSSSAARNMARQVVTSAVTALKALEALLPARLPSLISDSIHRAKLFVFARSAVIDDDWEKASRLSRRLCDAVGVQYLLLSNQSNTGTTTANRSAALTVAQAEAVLLTAEAVYHFDEAQACALLERLEDMARSAGLVQFVTTALCTRSLYLQRMGRQADAPCHARQAWAMDALLLRFNAAKMSKEGTCALVDGLDADDAIDSSSTRGSSGRGVQEALQRMRLDCLLV